jgi:isopentenyl-diphosphate delta-isomerase
MQAVSPNIILVNESDEAIGVGEKLMVHQKALLHRAFSILVFNRQNELLIHQRAENKYHSSGLWTNTCCGHPNEAEEISKAAHRRLVEEMGFDCDLSFLFKFHYITTFENNLTENEIDHVFVGFYDLDFMVNPDEVQAYTWKSLDEIREEVILNPEKYTFWFKEILKNKEFQAFEAQMPFLIE